MSDPLLGAILADPDNDDPRLVWADREGGERGELVVVQCRLEQLRRTDESSRAEMHRLYAREKELLAKREGFHRDVVWRRGFIHHSPVWTQLADTQKSQDKLFRDLPLLQSIELIDANQVTGRDLGDPERSIERLFELLPPGRIRAVIVERRVRSYEREEVVEALRSFLRMLARTAAGRELRSLTLASSDGGEELVPDLLRFPNLESFESGLTRVGRQWPELLRGLPTLRALGALDLPNARPALRALAGRAATRALRSLSLVGCDVGDNGARNIAASPRFANLQRLVIDRAQLSIEGIRAIAESPHLANLVELDVSRNQLSDEALACLAAAPFAPRLRVLRAADGRFTQAAVPHLLAFPSLERLDIRTDYDSTDRLRAIDDVIPSVSR